MCKLRINTSCSVPLSLRVLKHPDSTQEASRKPPSFIPFTSQGIVTPALPFANEPALSDHSYWSAVMPRTSPIDIPIPPVPGFTSPMKKIALVLTLMQGDKEEESAYDIGQALDKL